MSRLANIHANRLMEELITSGKDVIEIRGVGNWMIRVSHCMRNGKRSGGINVESYLIGMKFKRFTEDGRHYTLKFKGRLKKGWTSKQLRRMFTDAYNALELEKIINGQFLQKDKRTIYTDLDRFYNGTIGGKDLLTGKIFTMPTDNIEILTTTPEEWYTHNKMQNSLNLYKKKTEHAKKYLL